MTADIVLWLDLADANQLDEGTVRDSVPAGAEILRLTEHGATRCPAGTPVRWRPVLDAIDRLVRRARERERGSPGCRYWITGRAGLPAFFYLGHRLGKMAAITFLHQARNGEPVVPLRLDATDRGRHGPSAPYFTRTPWPIPRTESAAPVALVVSSQKPASDSKIQDALAQQQRSPAAIVRADSDATFDAAAVPAAMRELEDIIREICAAHPARKTLAVFLTGPTSLAFLAGNAINPRACRDVEVFDYDGHSYTPAFSVGIPERNLALWLGACPRGTKPLKLQEEIRAIQLALGQSTHADRITLVPIPGARPMDLAHELRNRRPSIIQFSGHGSPCDLTFEDDTGTECRLDAAELVELLRMSGDPVRLAVIAACYSTAYADALLAHVGCVIVMRGKVGDDDARRFATELYVSLAAGDSVPVAFDRASQVMRLERLADGTAPPEHEAPRLIERDPGHADELFLVRRA